jgi:hypothetical protein
MRRSIRTPARLVTLLAFIALATMPRLAHAQSTPEELKPSPPALAPPPGYPAAPPGYYYPPQPPPLQAYPQPPTQPYLVAPPPAVRFEERPRWGLFAAGMAMFGGAWLPTALTGYVIGDYYDIIPIIGPLWYVESSDDASQRFLNFVLVMDSAVQATGLVLAIVGAATKHKVAVPTRVTLAPAVEPGGGLGLVALGHF